MAQSLKDFARKKKVQFFLFNFTDLFGNQRAKLVPASAVEDMQKSGAGFAGFAHVGLPVIHGLFSNWWPHAVRFSKSSKLRAPT